MRLWRVSCLLTALGLAVVMQSCSGTPPPPSLPDSFVRVYVTNEGSGDLSVIDTANNQVVATIPLGKRPRGVHISPDGKTAYVALSGSPNAPPGVDESTLPPPDRTADGIGSVDTTRNSFLKLLPSGTDPEEFAISRDGTRAYVANEDSGLCSLVELATGKILLTVPVGEEPEGVAITPDGRECYVTSENNGLITVIATADNSVVASFKVGLRPRKVAFLPNGSKGYVSLENDGAVAVVDVVKHVVSHKISLQGEGVKPMGLVVSPDGRRLYITTGRFGRLFAVDTTTDQVVGSVAVGPRPWGVAITPDGKTLYTANGPSNDVSVIDAGSLTVTAKIKVGDRPWGIAILAR